MTNEQKDLISNIFNCPRESIQEIKSLDSMTNRNEIFSIRGVTYVLRSPGEGANELVNRTNELSVYYHIKSSTTISDSPIYFDHISGLKITKFIECAKRCDSTNMEDCKRSMKLLKTLHNLNIIVPHNIDIRNMLLTYEKLMKKSKYGNYEQIRDSILYDIDILSQTTSRRCLTHFDPNPDNFLLTPSKAYLLDWEYAGMFDPLVDIAMFAIYSGYSKQQIVDLAHLYDRNICNEDVARILTYCAVAGLLWSNWCEYKELFGVSFGDYAKQQYEYAEEFTGAYKWKL